MELALHFGNGMNHESMDQSEGLHLENIVFGSYDDEWNREGFQVLLILQNIQEPGRV